jgi:hypothetical protein
MTKNNTRQLRMGCGEALCGALARQQGQRPARSAAPASGPKSGRTPRNHGRSR